MNIEPGKYIVDVAQSSVTWKGSYVVGKEHAGTVSLASGNFDISDRSVSGEFVIDMKTINDGDLPDDESKSKLVGHLMSDDFFSVEKFPTATLKIKTATAGGEVIADLTIKGITNEIKFSADFNGSENDLSLEASFEIDRSLWDIRFGSGKFFKNLGDDLIKDTIGFIVKIQAKRQ